MSEQGVSESNQVVETQKSGLGRRRFLKTAAGGALGYGAWRLGKRFGLLSETERFSEVEFEGNRVVVDAEGLPVRVETRDGERIEFDMGEMRRSREEAKETGEPVVGGVFKVMSKIDEELVDLSVREHPVLSELPEDVLSEDELEARGLKIIQPDSTKFHVRASAFEDGGVFENLPSEERVLTIVLVEGPMLLKGYLQDERYEGLPIHALPVGKVRINGEERLLDSALTGEEIDQMRQERLDELGGSLERARGDWVEGKLDRGQARNTLVSNKGRMRATEDGTFTDGDIVLPGLLGSRVGATGWYENDYVFVAVGERRRSDLVSVYFDEEGKLQFLSDDETAMGRYAAPAPRPEMSCPDPAMWDPSDAGVKGRGNPGLVLRHELRHDVSRRDGKRDNEDEMDREVVGQIERAWDEWRESGFEQGSGDRGYCFVFKVSNGLGEGYVLS